MRPTVVKTWRHEFRVTFARIGDLRSLVSTHVNVLALTAAATQKTLQVVSQRLSLKGAAIVTPPSFRPNIIYNVHPLQNLDGLSTTFSVDLKRQDGNTE